MPASLADELLGDPLPGTAPAAPPAALRDWSRAPILAWLPYLLLLGPGVLFSLATCGWTLGLASAATANHAGAVAPHLQTLATCIAGLAGACAALTARLTGRAGRHLARIPLWLVLVLGALICAAAVLAGANSADLNGLSNTGQCFMAAAAGLWFFVLCDGEGVLAREPGHTHAERARRALVESAKGNIVHTNVACTAILIGVELFVRGGIAARTTKAAKAGLAAPFPGTFNLHSLAVTVVNSTANALTEELSFAVIVLLLARRGWRWRWIIAVAAALRAAMHLYYGLPGLGMAAFSGVNAYAVLRWRRLWPLVLVHAGYDAGAWALGYAVPSGVIGHALSIALLGAALWLGLAADKALRPTLVAPEPQFAV